MPEVSKNHRTDGGKWGALVREGKPRPWGRCLVDPKLRGEIAVFPLQGHLWKEARRPPEMSQEWVLLQVLYFPNTNSVSVCVLTF